MRKKTDLRDTPQGWMRRFVLAQVAIQIGVALTPFWAITVQAAINNAQDDRLLSGSAQHASGLAQAQQSGNLNGYLSQQAAGATRAQVQEWLQNFGTARVELGTDDRFKPHTGAVDLLLPLYKSEQRLFFTQNGLRNQDGQFTGNFGLGQRHFINDWMLGYNAFYDQNFSRDHKRVGTGLEAWRDYLKLSGNGYYRLSGWKNSVDVEDYDARPANGFDLRAEAWLPAYPSIGGKLMYEKYYGDEVALFGKDRRQKNPDAITAGLSYTPVPLVSLTADHKKGGSQDETAFGLQLTYQLGQSLASQLDPAGVNLKRTLAGSGMDLVERNNNIVLEYRKQQLIDLRLPKEISGASGMTVPIGYQLTSKYGLSKIDWNDAALVAAGGKVESLGGGKYQLVLPKYQAGASNSYPLSGVAVDTRNNTSNPSSTLISVSRPAVSAAKSTITATPETILANGSATSAVTITLLDDEGLPVTGLAAELTVTLKEALDKASTSKITKATPAPAQPAMLSNVTEEGNGVYTLTLTAGTRPAMATLNTALEPLVLKAVEIKQISDVDSAVVADGNLKLVLDNVAANGTATNRVQARVTDATGNPVAGVTVTFTLSGAAQVAAGSSLTAISDAQGYVSLSFTDTVAEKVTVSARTANGGSANADTQFIADVTTASLSQNDLSADKTTALANGTDRVTYRAAVKDAKGNPVAGISVQWRSDAGRLSADSSVTGADGVATVMLTSTVAGLIQVQGAVGSAAAVNAPVVNFDADTDTGRIGANDLTVDKPVAVANGTELVTYSAIVKDGNGNPLVGQTVQWQTSQGDLSADSSVTELDGKATIVLTSTLAGQAQVMAELSGKQAVNAPLVTFIADATSALMSSNDLTVDKTRAVANGTDKIIYTAVVKDAHGNVVPNKVVSWTTDGGHLSATSSVTDANGVATVKLTNILVGQVQVQGALALGGGAPVNAPLVNFTADAGSGGIGSNDLSADKSSAIANGNDVVTYTAIVKDANGNLLEGVMVEWRSTSGNLAGDSSVTNAEGKAIITLTSTQAGQAQVTAALSGHAAVNAPQVSFNADTASAQIGSGDLTVDKNAIIANSSDTAIFTAVVKDANSNLVAGITVTWGTDLGHLSGTTSTTNANGEAIVRLTGTQSGVAQVTAAVNAKPAANAPPVTLKADDSSAQIGSGDLTADKPTAVANGSELITYTAVVKDINGNVVSGITVNWETNFGTLNGSTSTTNDNGEATITLNSIVVGNAVVTAQPGSGNIVSANSVTFTADDSTAQIGNGDLTADKPFAVANGSELITYTAIVKDAKGNRVPNLTVNWDSNLGDLSNTTSNTNSNGEATITLSSMAAGNAVVTATAGNSSPANANAVTFTADDNSAQIGSGDLTADKPSAVADGVAVITYTAVVKDANGNVVPDLLVNWGTDVGDLSNVSSTTNDRGEATVKLSSIVAGNAVVTARPGTGTTVSASAVIFTADASSARIGNNDVSVDKTTAVADGTEPVTYSAVVKDAKGNLVAGQTVNWITNGGDLSANSSQTDENGVATIILTNTRIGVVQVNAAVGSGAAVNAPTVTFEANASTGNIDSNDLTADKLTAVANGAEVVTYTAVVKDALDNPVSGQVVNWQSSLGNLSAGSSVTGADGAAIITLTSTQIGDAQVTAALTGKPTVNAPVVNFTADTASAQIGSGDLKVDKNIIVANSSDTATFTAIVKDANSNLVSGITVNWGTDLGNLNDQTSITNASGEATIRLTGTLTGVAQVTAAVNGKPAVNAPPVTLNADDSSAQIGNGDLTVDKNNAVANGTDVVTYTAMVKDANGNVISGMTVTWDTDLGNLNGTSSTTNTDGKATITLSSMVAGTATVTAKPGNGSTVSASTVTFTADSSSAQIGSGDLTADKDTAVADGVALITYTAIVKDAQGNVVPGLTVNWGTDLGNLSGTTSNTNSNGEATIMLRSTEAGNAVVTATVGSNSATASAVIFTADASSAQIGSGDLTADTHTAVANGVALITYTAIVKDAKGNPVPSLTVTWVADFGNLSGPTSMTNANGEARITLRSMVAGPAIITAQPGSGSVVSADSVTFTADASSAQIGAGDLTADKDTTVADGVALITYTAIVKDVNGNVVPSLTVNWGTSLGNLSETTSITNTEGKATITLNSTEAGNAVVTATVGSNVATASAVIFTADASSAQIGAGDLTADKPTAVANGTAAITYTAIVTDAHGNRVSDLPVNWESDLGNLSGASSITDANGEATITLTSTTAGPAVVSARPGNRSTVVADAVAFTADESTAQIGAGNLQVDKTTVVANNTDKATYTALVKDAKGNVVPNYVVAWTTSKGNLSGANSTTDENGVATITLSDTLVGAATVTATVNDVGTSAEVVNFIPDLATAHVNELVSDRTRITGTGTENALLTATVTDANGNLIPDFTVNWSTTLSTMSVAESQTGVDGKARAELNGITHTGTANITATVTAQAGSGSKNQDIPVRALLSVNGKLYWTMRVDYPSNVETTAANYCAAHGGGRLLRRADVADFGAGRGDIATMSVPGEFANVGYGLAGEWSRYQADINSINGITGIQPGTGASYICVK